MRRRAFTLIELMVVIAIIGLLAAVAVPVTARVREGGKAAACVSNLRQLGGALHLYLGDHNQIMPRLVAMRASTDDGQQAVDNTLNAYVPDTRIFACPGDGKKLYASTGTSYLWNSLIDGQPASELHLLTSGTGMANMVPVLTDKDKFHPYAPDKINILYADGHASQDMAFSTSPQ